MYFQIFLIKMKNWVKNIFLTRVKVYQEWYGFIDLEKLKFLVTFNNCFDKI